ncbi:MAG TPA: 1-acyl-sn-glycerol-3-phosphate acyltransferase [Acidimicrobiales bacterium]|nr:1-acyl-sn-glycerol-3-phosphate acyltransferase [Acidimicrobiales bacterium]
MPPRLVRRVALPIVVVLEVATIGLLLVVGLIGLLAAPFDRRLRLARLAAMGISYLLIELVALAVLLGLWLQRPWRDDEWWDATHTRLLGRAIGLVLAAAGRWTNWRMDLDEPASTLPSTADPVNPEPASDLPPTARPAVVVLARHGGIGDSFALVWLLAAHYQRKPRVVLKRILQWEPMIDIALTRTGSCFLGEHDPEAQIRATAASLQPGDALLLFPEGGNWTPRRRWRAISSLLRRHRTAEARAAGLMTHVLPPRSGGVLACLETRPDLPIVVVAHTGLDRITSAGGLWRALPFRAAMEVRWWPPAPPPSGEEERVAWLLTEWAVIDEWIESRRLASADPER